MKKKPSIPSITEQFFPSGKKKKPSELNQAKRFFWKKERDNLIREFLDDLKRMDVPFVHNFTATVGFLIKKWEKRSKK